MNTIILDAIKNQHVLSVTYKGIPRKVEPHAYGNSSAGNDLLRCFQTHGQHTTPGHDWELLTVSKMVALSDTEETFAGPRSGYRRGDKATRTIYAEL